MKKTIFKRYLVGMFMICFSLMLAGCGDVSANTSDNGKQIVNAPTTQPKEVVTTDTKVVEETKNIIAQDLKVNFIDVGQGLSVFIDYGDFDLLFDGGDNKYGTTVLNYLNEQKVDDLEYVVASHMDADHIGGLDVVINSDLLVENVIDSGTSKDTKTCRDYKAAITSEKSKYSEDEDNVIKIDDNLTLKFIETGDNYKDENDNSVVLLLNYNNKKILLTGDMESQAEKASLNKFSDIDILQVGHHGSRTSSSNEFLDIAKPEYAVVSCGQDNKYKHPHQETMTKLKNKNIETYRTDQQGSIIATIDSNGVLMWNTQPTEVITPKKEVIVPIVPVVAHKVKTPVVEEKEKFDGVTQQRYVGSVKSDKYHYPSCSSAKRINAGNLIEFTSKEDAESKGYVPCGRCKP